MLIEDMAQFLREHNSGGRFIVHSWEALEIQNVNPEKMTCPRGFYYDSEHRIIRRTESLMDCFKVLNSGDAL